MPPRDKSVRDPSSPATRTRSKGNGGRLRRGGNGEPETPRTRAKRKRHEAKRKEAKRVKPFVEVPDPDPEEEVAKTPKKVVGKGKKKRKLTTPTKCVRPKIANVLLSESEESSFHPTEGDDEDEEIKSAAEEAVQDDSSDDDDDDDESVDSMVQQLLKSNEKGRADGARASASFEAEERRFEAEEQLRNGEQRRNESNRCAQEGAADPPSDNDVSSKAPRASRNEERGVLWNAELEVPTVEKNVAQRISIFVKNNLFRRIKFVTSQQSFTKAFQKVNEVERPKHPYLFQLTYGKCFTLALNQKRSTCEQAGKQIAIDAIKDCKIRGEEFFTFEEFCTLRRATSEREKRAFFWFFNNFLECVCGANIWRIAKTTQLVSGAQESNGSKIVSISDEAFGLLLIDNYLEKWTINAEEGAAGTGTMENNSATTGEAMTATTTEAETASGQGKKKKAIKIPGKYTHKKAGHCKFSGWSGAGISQFNALRKLVKDDRACPEAERMERELMRFCRNSAKKKHAGDNEDDELDGSAAPTDTLPTAEAMMPVEADWDSNGD